MAILVSENVIVCPLKFDRSASTDIPGRTSNVYAVQNGVDEFDRPNRIAVSIFAFREGPSTDTKPLFCAFPKIALEERDRLALVPNNESPIANMIPIFITTCLCFD